MWCNHYNTECHDCEGVNRDSLCAYRVSSTKNYVIQWCGAYDRGCVSNCPHYRIDCANRVKANEPVKSCNCKAYEEEIKFKDGQIENLRLVIRIMAGHMKG